MIIGQPVIAILKWAESHYYSIIKFTFRVFHQEKACYKHEKVNQSHQASYLLAMWQYLFFQSNWSQLIFLDQDILVDCFQRKYLISRIVFGLEDLPVRAMTNDVQEDKIFKGWLELVLVSQWATKMIRTPNIWLAATFIFFILNNLFFIEILS